MSIAVDDNITCEYPLMIYLLTITSSTSSSATINKILRPPSHPRLQLSRKEQPKKLRLKERDIKQVVLGIKRWFSHLTHIPRNTSSKYSQSSAAPSSRVDSGRHVTCSGLLAASAVSRAPNRPNRAWLGYKHAGRAFGPPPRCLQFFPASLHQRIFVTSGRLSTPQPSSPFRPPEHRQTRPNEPVASCHSLRCRGPLNDRW